METGGLFTTEVGQLWQNQNRLPHVSRVSAHPFLRGSAEKRRINVSEESEEIF